MRQPDFNQLLKILNKEAPDRPTLFEFFLNDTLFRQVCPQYESYPGIDDRVCLHMAAFNKLGYDYFTTMGADFGFTAGEHESKQTISINDGSVIHDRASFAAYQWPDVDDLDYSRLTLLESVMPAGMKAVIHGPCGVLENVIRLVGYEDLCLMISDDEDLAMEIFAGVGSRLERYYEISAAYPSVGACISNDDWGFKTQTMLSPAQMRQFVIPWHKRIVAAIHKAGKPAILHSCGNLESVMDDIIHHIGYDGKHSYEDVILPVEKAYERCGKEIAILGGIDLDYLCRSTPEKIIERGKALIKLTQTRGSYALGSGNSIPEYVPVENYQAMRSVVA